MDCPLIGVPTFGRNFERHFSLPAGFVEGIRRAGGIPVLMPPGEPNLDQWIETIDGLLIPSGPDVDPTLYEGATHQSIDGVDPERDGDEVDLVLRAIEADLPLLATCRGMQLLNVALGGDLFPHIPECIDGAIEHRVPAPVGRMADDHAADDHAADDRSDHRTADDRPDHRAADARAFGPVAHDVVLDPGSRLANVMGAVRMRPMSWHHQAVDEVGDGLVIVGHAPDGVVEAMEMPGHAWLFAVQWHPEITAAEDPVQRRLFDGLVRAARGEM